MFGLFDLLGMTFSPHIRDLADLPLHRLGPTAGYARRWPHAGPLLTAPIRTGLIADAWNDLLRLAASMKSGHTTASLLIARLHAGARQHSLAKALYEYGRLVRTVFVLRYLTDTQLATTSAANSTRARTSTRYADGCPSSTRANSAADVSTTRSTRRCASP